MGICETVVTLANEFVKSKTLNTPHQKLQVELLRLMPLYKEINNLVAWERTFMAALPEPDDESDVGQLIYEIFSFGRYNMYGAFDKQGTYREFDWLVKQLARAGVIVPPHHDLDDW
jgi:hypothetical protein